MARDKEEVLRNAKILPFCGGGGFGLFEFGRFDQNLIFKSMLLSTALLHWLIIQTRHSLAMTVGLWLDCATGNSC